MFENCKKHDGTLPTRFYLQGDNLNLKNEWGNHPTSGSGLKKAFHTRVQKYEESTQLFLADSYNCEVKLIVVCLWRS